MNTTSTFHHTSKNISFESDLAPYVDIFIEYLKQGRYKKQTIYAYLRSIDHFSRWANNSGLSINQLDESVVNDFINGHLPNCNCPSPCLRCPRSLKAASAHILRILRNSGIIKSPVISKIPVEEELSRFNDYMRNVQGLKSGTRYGYIHIVRHFLLKKFADKNVVISALQPSDVRQFITEQLSQYNTISHSKIMATSLKSYFRYRTICGDQVNALVGVIALPAQWSMARLPKALTIDEVDSLLASFTPELPSPRRGLAMIRCALDMGLRASEIARIKLSDINWQEAAITLRQTKSLREDIMPLPETTGRAIADYIQFERNSTTNQALFVRNKAPYDLPIGPHAVSRVVHDAYQRIGLTHFGTHALRHTLANQLLEHGSSLKEVADILRHKSLDTSLIYTKIDSRRLLYIALPWPGSKS